MVYITVKLPPIYRQMSLEEFLFNDFHRSVVVNANTTNTRTYERERVPQRLLNALNVERLITVLENFTASAASLYAVKDRSELYDIFPIPKRSGGLRMISAPVPRLMETLRVEKSILQNDFGALYHTAAFAYVKERSTVDAIKRHQSNESKWFGKGDLHDFFGSTTVEWLMYMLSMIYPFCEVVKTKRGYDALAKAIDLTFLNGGLPQGTPISPMLTNLMMIPVDYKLYNSFRDHNGQKYVYTRYADDFIISSRYTFDVQDMCRLITDTLHQFNAPFSLNERKTRYGSSSGSNWNLGVMLNKDNEITVGHKNKKRLQSILHNYLTDKENGVGWNLKDMQEVQGLVSYYSSVERDNINAIIAHVGATHGGVDVMGLLTQDIKRASAS